MARVRPAGAGRLRVEVRHGDGRARVTVHGASVRLRLDTREAAALTVRVRLVPRRGYGAGNPRARHHGRPALARARVRAARACSRLEARLRELRYALRRVDGLYAYDTVEAVLAFQKVERLPWTGRVDARLWRRLAAATVPRARYAGDHIEVSKGQPVPAHRARRPGDERHPRLDRRDRATRRSGRWQVYRKVAGWDWVLWYPMYFLRGLRDPRLSVGAGLPGVARLRARADVDRAAALLGQSVRPDRLRLLVSEPDPVVRRLREEISELDRAALAAVNARLELVAELKRHKEAHGIDFVDPERESEDAAPTSRRRTAGRSRPTASGELLAGLLDLTKRELAP